MRPLSIIATTLALLFTAACTDDSYYPGSGEQCGPNDAVQDLRPLDCVPKV